VVLEGEERIEAQRLGEIAECHVLGEHGRVRQPWLLEHVEGDADFHDAPPAAGAAPSP
jgi:hypothetical protein